jgi:hypothetical protein
MSKRIRYYTFKNKDGESIELRGDLSIEDLLRMGWTDFRIVPPGQPLKEGQWVCDPKKQPTERNQP